MKEQERVLGRTVSKPDLAAIRKRYEAAKGIRMCGLSVEGGGDALEALEAFIKHARTDLPAVVEALEEAQGKLDAVEDYEHWQDSHMAADLYGELVSERDGYKALAKVRVEALKGVWVIAKQRVVRSNLEPLLVQIQAQARDAITKTPEEALAKED